MYQINTIIIIIIIDLTVWIMFAHMVDKIPEIWLWQKQDTYS